MVDVRLAHDVRLRPGPSSSSTSASRWASASSCWPISCGRCRRRSSRSSSTARERGPSSWRITLPLCRPALAAVGTLEFTWIYNDFLWADFISNPDKLPSTSSLNNLRGQFFTDYNLLAAVVLVAFPHRSWSSCSCNGTSSRACTAPPGVGPDAQTSASRMKCAQTGAAVGLQPGRASRRWRPRFRPAAVPLDHP